MIAGARRSPRTAHAPVRTHRTRGTVYLIVLSTVTLVVAISLTGLTLAQAQRRTASLTADTDHARLLAMSGIEVGVEMINNVTAWRSRADSRGTIAEFPLTPGRVRVDALDPIDDNLTDAATDPVTLRATAKVGQAIQTLAVRLEPQYTPMSVLARGLHAGGTMVLNSASIIATAPISANVSIAATSSSIIADAESLAIAGGTFHGAQRILSRAETMPSAAVAAYASEGTVIPRSALAGGELRDVLLSPQSNPLNESLNDRGVYIIDCGGQSVNVRNIRVVGTLILRNAGSSTRVDEGVLMSPAVPGYPALIVDGPLEIRTDGRSISEGGTVNFNPPETPVAQSANVSMNDTFTSGITGAVYATGSISFDGTLSLHGPLIAGTNMTVRGSLTIGRYLDTLSFPPPGLRDRMIMAAVAGSWERMVDVDVDATPLGEPSTSKIVP